jgi:hypothetical protein
MREPPFPFLNQQLSYVFPHEATQCGWAVLSPRASLLMDFFVHAEAMQDGVRGHAVNAHKEVAYQISYQHKELHVNKIGFSSNLYALFNK